MNGLAFAHPSTSAPSPAEVKTIKVYYAGFLVCIETRVQIENGLEPERVSLHQRNCLASVQ